MAEEKIYTRSQALEMIRKSNIDLINRIHDPDNEVNRIVEAKRKEFTEAEITRRVKEQVTTEREALATHIDKLTIRHDEITGLGSRLKASYDGLLIELKKLENRNQDLDKVCNTLIEFTANVHGLSTTLDKIINHLERRSKTDRDVVA